MTTVRGRCHCGEVRFEVDDAPERAVVCNCSVCTMKGYVHWIVAADRFRLTAGERALRTYRFNTGVAKHTFCGECGIAPFYTPRSDPDCIDVNLRCLEGVDFEALPTDRFDGRNWEDAERSWDAPG